MERFKGLPNYVAMEGVIRCGKTTQMGKLEKWAKEMYGEENVVRTFEPGGTPIAAHIRTTVQGTEFPEPMDPYCETYLYAAARAQSLRQVVTPALSRGQLVLSDRSVMTSLAYQGGGRGLGVEKVWDINNQAVGDVLPGLVLFLDTDLTVAMARAKEVMLDKFEAFPPEFFEDCRQIYLELCLWQPEMFRRVDGNGSIDEVSGRLIDQVRNFVTLPAVGLLGSVSGV